jgi:hypothetical protein
MQIGAGFLPRFGIGEFIGTRSDAVRTLITPAGWAFAIWGPLFLLSVAFAIWQALPSQRTNALLDRIAWPAAVALAAQGVWSIYTQIANLTVVSVMIILVSLVGLLVVLRALVRMPLLSRGERVFVAPAFTALAAWLTAASIVNVSASLKYHGIAGAEPSPGITTLMIVIGAATASAAVGILEPVTVKASSFTVSSPIAAPGLGTVVWAEASAVSKKVTVTSSFRGGVMREKARCAAAINCGRG